jgi:hypothetical protein
MKKLILIVMLMRYIMTNRMCEKDDRIVAGRDCPPCFGMKKCKQPCKHCSKAFVKYRKAKVKYESVFDDVLIKCFTAGRVL